MESVTAFLSWVETTQLSLFIHESAWAFPTIESIHVIALALVVGSIAIVDLRLLGLASTKRKVTELCREVLPWTWAAFVTAAISGALMFVSHANEYFGNTAFRLKFLLLLLAGVNMMIFQFITYRGVVVWDNEASLPLPARLAGAISLACWIGVVFFGRWIGFTMVLK